MNIFLDLLRKDPARRTFHTSKSSLVVAYSMFSQTRNWPHAIERWIICSLNERTNKLTNACYPLHNKRRKHWELLHNKYDPLYNSTPNPLPICSLIWFVIMVEWTIFLIALMRYILLCDFNIVSLGHVALDKLTCSSKFLFSIFGEYGGVMFSLMSDAIQQYQNSWV